MAIIKEIETQYGINAAYHEITTVRIDVKNDNYLVEVTGYINETLKDKLPVMTQSFTLPLFSLPEIDSAAIYTALENALKQTQVFKEVTE